MKYKMEGYFSVEAALVFPLVMGTILLLVYLGFYQYNRCLLEFDVAMIALRGCSCDEEEPGAILNEMERTAEELSAKRYIAWDGGGVNIAIRGNHIRASGDGKLYFHFGFLIQKEGDGLWQAEANYENKRLDPVAFVRGYKKITGGE